MKLLVVLTSLFAAASAGIAGFGGVGLGGNGGYSGNVGGTGGYTGSVGGGSNGGYTPAAGFPQGTGIGGFGGGGFSGGASYPSGDATAFGGGAGGGGGQIRKFVSVHIAPEEAQFTQTKVIRAGGIPDKHVNIIFVKAPSASNQQQTEVILPEMPKQKTLVYVLVKKHDNNKNDVRVRAPKPTSPSKPEVYFIRYKGAGGVQAGEFSGDGGNAGSSNSGSFGGSSPSGVFGGSGSDLSASTGGYSG